jgi:drug/metabolite transporter (DMT)-like permease
VRGEAVPAGHRGAGVAFGIVAAAGQAWGAVLSRYAFQRAHEIGFALDGITAAYQRLWGGVASIGLLLLFTIGRERLRPASTGPVRPGWRRAWPWIAANAVVGPALGVSCYQWALKQAPSSLVLPVVATTPLAAMLLALLLDGTRPSPRALAGAAVAVIGVVILVRAS